MTLWDVNLWVYAFRADSPLHVGVARRLNADIANDEQFLFCPTVASSFLRLVTNPRIFKKPSDLVEAWSFVDRIRESPRAVYADVDELAFDIFQHLSVRSGATGNRLPDALLAGLALRHGARLITADAGFHEFPGLIVEVVAF